MAGKAKRSASTAGRAASGPRKPRRRFDAGFEAYLMSREVLRRIGRTSSLFAAAGEDPGARLH